MTLFTKLHQLSGLLTLITVASGFAPLWVHQHRHNLDFVAAAHRRQHGTTIATTTQWKSSIITSPASKRLMNTNDAVESATTSSNSSKKVFATIRKSLGGPHLGLGGPNKRDLQALASAAAFVAIDVAFRRLFQLLNISFPSSLGACSILLFTLLLLPSQAAGRVAEHFLQPGAALLAKWLPLFFVPSLITLPLADTSSVEVGKVAVTVVGGFLATLLSTAFSVQWVRKLKTGTASSSTTTSTNTMASKDDNAGDSEEDLDGATNEKNDESKLIVTATPSPPKKFSDELVRFLSLLTLGSGIASLIATTPGRVHGGAASAIEALFFLSTTVVTFCWGSRFPARVTQLVHPLVTCTVATWTVLAGWAAVTHQSLLPASGVLKRYTRGAASGSRGAGDALLFLLGPAVVSLAVSMYERRQLVRDNVPAVATGITVSTFGGLFGTALAVRWLDLVDPFLRLSLLSRNITSPLAMAIAGILGADVSLAVSMVVVTGLIGANFGASILDACGVRDAVARGLGIGAAAHGLGTAAFVNEKDAFPFAAIVRGTTWLVDCLA